LTVLAIYGAADKSGLQETKYKCFKYWCEGCDYTEIARLMHLKRRTVEKYISSAHTPVNLIPNIPPKFQECLVNACPGCGSNMYFIKDHDQWECEVCDYVSEVNLQSIFILA